MEWKLKLLFFFVFFFCGNFPLNSHGCLRVSPATQLQDHSNSNKLMVCYYEATSYFPVDKVPADLCTHIIYSYGIVNPAGIQPHYSKDPAVYRSLVAIKKKNPKLKVLLSLQPGFSSVVDPGSDELMSNFSAAAVLSLQKYGFDGLDLDWEYPNETEKMGYDRLIKILSFHLKKANLLLSAALPNNIFNYKKAYNTETLNAHMDFMTAMTYDFHMYMKRDNVTGYNSPLYAPKGELASLSSAGMIDYYVKMGIQPNKLLLGLPSYGRSWELASAKKHGLHAPAIGKGAPSPYMKIKGVYIYPDTCVALQLGATKVKDQVNGAVYLYHNTSWVAFDNEDTVRTKIAFMKSNNLGGVGIWALHLDDLPGVCKNGPLPLLRAIRSAL